MSVTPTGQIWLLNTPLASDSKNQIDFENAEAQFNYFYSRRIAAAYQYEDCTYLRKNSILYVPVHIDNIWNCNYVMYRNRNFTNKVFYNFVTRMEYISDDCTALTLECDSYQTWQFDFTFQPSFVEREMIDVSSDVPGANLLPEGLEIGELKGAGSISVTDLSPYWVIAYSGDKLEFPYAGQNVSLSISQNCFVVNGIPSTIAFIVCTDYASYVNLYGLMNSNQVNGDGTSISGAYVVTTFTIPALSIQGQLANATHLFYGSSAGESLVRVVVPNAYLLTGYDVAGTGARTFNQAPSTINVASRPTSIQGYTPRNKKLLTYPYQYLAFNPNNGSSKVYRYENFTGGTCSFKVMSEVNPNPQVVFIPQNYRGITGDSMQDIAALTGYPTLANRSDTYNMWLAQNSELLDIRQERENFNYITSSLSSSALLGASIATGSAGGMLGATMNILGAAKNHELNIKEISAQKEAQSLIPDKASVGSSSATLIGYGLNDENIFTKYSIKEEQVRRLDQYFDMFGYQTNEVKIPNLKNRPTWNYIKTEGANIEGNLPQEDIEKLKNLFDSGITIWHNTQQIYNYSYNNR